MIITAEDKRIVASEWEARELAKLFPNRGIFGQPNEAPKRPVSDEQLFEALRWVVALSEVVCVELRIAYAHFDGDLEGSIATAGKSAYDLHRLIRRGFSPSDDDGVFRRSLQLLPAIRMAPFVGTPTGNPMFTTQRRREIASALRDVVREVCEPIVREGVHFLYNPVRESIDGIRAIVDDPNTHAILNRGNAVKDRYAAELDTWGQSDMSIVLQGLN